MKKKLLFLLPVLLVLTLLIAPAVVDAQTNMQDRYGGFIDMLTNTARGGGNYNTVKVPADRVVNDNFVRYAEEIVIDGDISGDLIVGAFELTVNGNVDGDVIAAAETITINGDVAGNVRIAATTVEINGTVGKNANIFGGTILLNESAAIGWTLAFFAGEIDINSPIGGNIYGYGGNVTLNSTVGSNVTILLDELGQVTLESAAEIGGDLTYRSDIDAVISSGATIGGDTVHNMPFADVIGAQRFLKISWLFAKVIGLFSLLLIGTLLVSLLRKKTLEVTNAMWNKPTPTILWGLLILIATPIAAIIVSLTIIGIPLGMIIMGVYALLIYISKIFVGVLIGEKILNTNKEEDKRVSIIWTMMLGTFILYVVLNVPYVGWIFSLIITTLFLGTVWRLVHTALTTKKESKSDAKSKS